MEHLTAKEAADYLKVHINTLRKYVHEEGLPVLKFPGRRKWVFRKDLVDDWVYERSQPDVYVKGKRICGDEHSDNDYGRLRILRPDR